MTDDDETRLARGTASRHDSCLAPKFKKNKKENKQERQKMAYAFHFSIERTGRRLRNFKTFTDSRMNCRVSRSVGSRVR